MITMCGSSDVESRADLLAHVPVTKDDRGRTVYATRVLHAGLLTHKCNKPNHPSSESCECECKHRWIRNFQ